VFAAEACHVEGMVLAGIGRDDDAVDAFEEAVDLAEKAGAASGVAASRLELGPALARLGHDEEAVRTIEQARVGLVEADDAVGLARAAWALAGVHRQHGRYEEALGELGSAAEQFEAVGVVPAMAQARLEGAGVLDALAHLVEPADPTRLNESLIWAEQAIAGFEAHGDPRFVAVARRAWGTTAAFAGRPDGLKVIDEARQALLAADATWEVAECDAAAARVLGYEGQYEPGIERAAAALDTFQRVGDGVNAIGVALLLGQLLVDSGQPEAGIGVFEQTVDLSDEQGLPALAAAAHGALAGLFDSLGRPAEAAPHRAAAEAFFAAP
jgi:tetratricopeptide (TPR) repeat protein